MAGDVLDLVNDEYFNSTLLEAQHHRPEQGFFIIMLQPGQPALHDDAL